MRRTRRTVKETVFTSGKDRELVLTIEDGYVWAHPKGTRQKELITIAGAWQHAVKMRLRQEAEEKRRERRKSQKAPRKRRAGKRRAVRRG